MVQYDDTAADDPVRIYDRGIDFAEPPANFGEYQLTYRTGDMVAPRIEALEPLGLELQDFASAIREGTTPVSNARLGARDRARPGGAGAVAARDRGEPVAGPPSTRCWRAAAGSDARRRAQRRLRPRRLGASQRGLSGVAPRAASSRPARPR